MDKFLKLIIIIIIIIGIVLIIYFFNNYKSLTLPDGSHLVKSFKFYKDMKNHTLKYLNTVYPTAINSFKDMSDLDIAIFYNSLWFYYNCDASFNQWIPNPNNVLEKHCWQSLPGCGSDMPKLPYTPQGSIYSYDSWINNNWTPWISSDSSIDPSLITSFSPGGPLWFKTVGPSPLFMPQRCIQRMVYNTDLPKIVNSKDGHNNKHSLRQPSLFSGKTGEWKSNWSYPKNWWKGISDNSYVEVTGADEPGMALSAATIWLNGAFGSGVFYNVGKSKRGRNKVDGAFILAEEMATTIDGKKALMENYYTIDPYQIIALLTQYPVYQKSPLVWFNDEKVECNWNMGAGITMSAIPNNNNGWDSINTFDPVDWFSWSSARTPVENRSSYGLPNKAIDEIRFGENYLADRISVQGPYDEAMCWMGVFLGYDSIQLSQSANGTGFWQHEIIHLRDLPTEVKYRDYSAYMTKYTVDECNVVWRTDNNFFENYMKKL
jgi:hypothetical protein